jgi:hypothetical protein
MSRLRSRRRLAAVALSVALGGAAFAAQALAHEHPGGGGHGSPPSGTLQSSWAVVNQVDGSGARGLVGVRQRGTRLTVSIVVHGLEPGSVHAAHVHGPDASCSKRTTRHAAELPDLVADEHGVASRTVALTVAEQVAGRAGYYVMVHANPTSEHAAENPPLACGTLPRR